MKKRDGVLLLVCMGIVVCATKSFSQNLIEKSDHRLALAAISEQMSYFGPAMHQAKLAPQDTAKVYLIKTRDGNEFFGTLVSEDGAKIVLKTEQFGEIAIQKINIKNMQLIKGDQLKAGVLWQEHMQSTRYFWQPNGYGLKKGEAYYQNVWVFFNQVSIGVTDNILVGGGIVPLFLFAGSPTPAWITPKVSFPIKKDLINVGVGGLFATVIGEPDINFGIAYGTFTIGPRNRNLTVGAGWGYAGDSWASRPIYSVNFITRVGPKGYFITENYIIDVDQSYFVLSMIGGRSMLGNAGLDYGLVIPISADIGQFIAIPWLGITIPISEKGRFK